MHLIDWAVLTATLAFIVIYGVWKSKGAQSMQTYLLGNNEARWWTVGLSVMATQASAITFMSTPGQAFHDGMGFVQFYFGMPLAIIIISITFVPIFHKLKVFTAYEFLEERFDLKTRSLTAILFLIQRGMAAGITIYAPAIILSTILGWNLNLLNFIIGILVVIYTVSGGTKAVNITQKQQMFVIMAGMFIAFGIILSYLPDNAGLHESLTLAGLSGKMNILDFSWNPENRYTLWSGILGGVFLFLSYFGTDQSQVQRYLSGKSIRESQMGLIFNGILKVPMQFFILLTGVMVFVFFQFNKAPIFFNPKVFEKSEIAQNQEFASIVRKHDTLFVQKKNIYEQILNNETPEAKAELQHLLAEEQSVRAKARQIIKEASPGTETNDKDYVFIYFILNYLPQGLIGLLLAVILSAAMSSTASELNALGTTTCVDIYKRNVKRDGSDTHYVFTSRLFTVGWGLVAIFFACYGTLFENLIQFVNIIGSLFYGTILGIFLIAFYVKRIGGDAVFYGALLAEASVIYIYKYHDIGYLWLNAVGCLGVIFFAAVFQILISSIKK